MELGYYEPCQKEYGDIADFVVLNTNITHLTGMARMGLCLPKGCKQHHYDAFVSSSLAVVNGFLDYLDDYYHHPEIDSMLVRSWTRVGMSLTKSDDYTEDWLNRTWAGVIPTTIIVLLILVIPLTANIIKYYKYKSAWSSQLKKPVLGENIDTDNGNNPQMTTMLNLDGNTTDLINANLSQQM